MSKYLLSGILGLIIGACTGVTITIFVYPFIFPPPEVNEQIAGVAAKTVISAGHFIHPILPIPFIDAKMKYRSTSRTLLRKFFFMAILKLGQGLLTMFIYQPGETSGTKMTSTQP